MLPIFIVDESFSALGEDQAPDLQIQGFSVGVRPDSSFASNVTFTAAGVIDGLKPLVETTVASGGTNSWIAAFDGANTPISFTLDDASLIGWLSVDVSPAAPLGTIIDLQLSSAFTALSNQGGAVMLNGSNGGLDLGDGRIDVDAAPLFEDDFESGNLSAWSSLFP